MQVVHAVAWCGEQLPGDERLGPSAEGRERTGALQEEQKSLSLLPVDSSSASQHRRL